MEVKHYENLQDYTFFYPSTGLENRVILEGVTLEQAQEHCQDDATKEEGVYFDGYTAE